jgi:hypothetical protein
MPSHTGPLQLSSEAGAPTSRHRLLHLGMCCPAIQTGADVWQTQQHIEHYYLWDPPGIHFLEQ